MSGKSDILKHLHANHIGAFQAAARLYNVAILVRRTNTASLAHIGQPYAVPKRLDCKAKTADFDVTPAGCNLPQGRRKSIAGLVVDPHMVGQSAFGEGKFEKAKREWITFSKLLQPAMATYEQQKKMTYIPNGGLYFVERNPDDPHYACVKMHTGSSIKAAKVIHGDFDLYGIVDMDAPDKIVRVLEDRLNNTHARSPKFFDVQHYVNNRIGVPMILHGSQETYASDHAADDLDVFFPDGRIEYAGPAAQNIADFYHKEFPGRTLFVKTDPATRIRNRYVSPGVAINVVSL